MSVFKKFTLVVVCLSVISCVPSGNFAPVADASGYEAVPTSGSYRVAAGDTLYSIAWRYGADYLALAKANNISAPFAIHTGQIIYLRGKPSTVVSTEVERPIVTVPAPPAERPQQVASVEKTKSTEPVSPRTINDTKEPNYNVSAWVWPAHGKLLALYSSRNKGIDIGGSLNAPVYASAPGKVVYAGNGLRGYGNLIILKHNKQLLSAYAYNKRLFVREGEWVKKGQIIAGMGRAQSGIPSLHFEIRKAGLPVNPMNLISK